MFTTILFAGRVLAPPPVSLKTVKADEPVKLDFPLQKINPDNVLVSLRIVVEIETRCSESDESKFSIYRFKINETLRGSGQRIEIRPQDKPFIVATCWKDVLTAFENLKEYPNDFTDWEYVIGYILRLAQDSSKQDAILLSNAKLLASTSNATRRILERLGF